jgi:hypothetical protein
MINAGQGRNVIFVQVNFLILTVKNPTKCNSVSKFLLFFILSEAQHVSGDTSPIIRSLNLHKQPLVSHTWEFVGRAVVGRCQVAYEMVQCKEMLLDV